MHRGASLSQEVELMKKYVRVIPDSHWFINSERISASIQTPIAKTFSEKEMKSFYNQFQYLSKTFGNDAPRSPTDFKDSFNFATKQKDFFKFLQKKGINLYYKGILNESARNERFAQIINDNPFPPTIETKSISDLNSNFSPYQYRQFGQLLLDGQPYEGQKKEILDIFISTIKGEYPYDTYKVKEAISRYLAENSNSLDFFHVGKHFAENYLKYDDLKQPITNFTWYLSPPKLVQSSLEELDRFLRLYGPGYNFSLLIANVPKAMHVYQMIQPSHYCYLRQFELANSSKNLQRIQFDQSHLLFCTDHSNFARRLEVIMQKETRAESGNGNDDKFYIIVHPENLMENELEVLKMLIRTRRHQKIEPKTKDTQLFPRILILTSLPKQFFNTENTDSVKDMPDFKEFPEMSLEGFCRFNEAWRKFDNVRHDIVLVSSDLPGAGKSYFINQAIKAIHPDCSITFSEESKEYFDITTTEIPASLKNKEIVHLTVSPELFNNEFRLMDKFYLLMQYGYYSLPNGDIISYFGKNEKTKPIFFIEIPNLDSDNQFEHFYDFPVAPYFDSGKVRVHDELESISFLPKIAHLMINPNAENKNIEIGFKRIIFNNNDITINPGNNEKITKILESVFYTQSIKNFADLLNTTSDLFLSNHMHLELPEFHHKNDRRILNGIERMMNSYYDLITKIMSTYGNMDEARLKKKRQMLSICCLRSILYVWHFLPSTSKSLILLVPQRLMCNSGFSGDSGALFIGFPSNEDNQPNGASKWKVELLNQTSNSNQWINDNSFITEFIEEFKEDPLFHMLTDPISDVKDINHRNAANEMALQSAFFDSLLLLFPKISSSSTENLHHLELARILLLLFSSDDHYRGHETEAIRALYDFNKVELAKGKFNELNIQWNLIDDLLYKLFHTNSLKQQFKNIKNIGGIITKIKNYFAERNLNYWDIIKMSFSKTYFCRFVELLLKITFQYFEILEGETGCGKTSSIQLLKALLKLFPPPYFGSNPEQINFKYAGIDLHGNYTQTNFQEDIQKFSNTSSKVIIFLDEINTSPAFQYIIDFIFNNPRVSASTYSFIGAINKYVEVPSDVRMMTRVGLKQKINRKLSKIKLLKVKDNDITKLYEDYDINKLAYKVKETPISVKSSVVCADPIPFDFSDDKFLPSEEINTIHSIIAKLLYQWDNSPNVNVYSIMKILCSFICDLFQFLRKFMNIREILSYRDVDRCGKVFIYVYDRLQAVNDRGNAPISSYAISIALYISLFLRFSETIVMKNDDNDKRDSIDLNEAYEQIIKRLNAMSIKSSEFIKIEKDQNNQISRIIIPIHQLMKTYITSKEKWDSLGTALPFIPDWHLCTLQFAYLTCFEYVLKNPNPVAPLPSLMLHLLILTLTVDITYQEKNSQLYSCLIIGPPGTSKSKAYQIYKEYYNSPNSSFDYFITTYLCSRSSDEKGLESQFLNAAGYLLSNSSSEKPKRAIVVLEEVGLANYNPNNPLKLLHYLCDKGIYVSSSNHPVIPIQISNYALDFANMNRNFLVCASLPSNEDFASAFTLQYLLKSEQRIRLNLDLFNQVNINEYIFMNLNGQRLEKNLSKRLEEYTTKYSYYLTVLQSLWQATREQDVAPEYFPMRPLFTLLTIMKELQFNQQNPALSPTLLRHLAIVLNSFISPGCRDANLLNTFLKYIKQLHPFFSTQGNQLTTIIYIYLFVCNRSFKLDDSQRPRLQNDYIDKQSVCDKILKGADCKKSSSLITLKSTETLSNQADLESCKAQILNNITSVKKDIQIDNAISVYSPRADRPILQEINDPITQFFQFFSDPDRNCLLIRTKNYEAYDFFHPLLELVPGQRTFDIHSINFVPYESQDEVQYCQRQFNDLYQVMINRQQEQNKQVFVYVGNNPFLDYIIDILNWSNQINASPTGIVDGFPLYFPSFPSHIKFIIILNEEDLYNTEKINPVPFPLIDRLDHIFIDKQILRQFYNPSQTPEKIKYLLLDPQEYQKVPINNPYFYNLEKSDLSFLREALNETDTEKASQILSKHYDPSTYVADLDTLVDKMGNCRKAIIATRSAMFKDVYIKGAPVYQITINDLIEEENDNDDDGGNGDDDDGDGDDDDGNGDGDDDGENELEYVVLKSDIFNNDSEYQLDYIEKMKKYFDDAANSPDYEYVKKFFIIFYVNTNDIFSKLQSSYGWPVIWIENLFSSDLVKEHIKEESKKEKSKEGSKKEKSKEEETLFIRQVCETILGNQMSSGANFKLNLYIECAKLKFNDIISLQKESEKKKSDQVSNCLLSQKGILTKNKKESFTIFDLIQLLDEQLDVAPYNNTLRFDKLRDEIKEGRNSDLNLIMRFLSQTVNGIPSIVQTCFLIVANYLILVSTTSSKSKNTILQISGKFKQDILNDIVSILQSLKEFDKKQIGYSELLFRNSLSSISNDYEPIIILYSLIVKFFNQDSIYFNSLERLETCLEALEISKNAKFVDHLFEFILDSNKLRRISNYINLKPSNYAIPSSGHLTIDLFKPFLNLRGALNTEAGKKFIDLFKQKIDFFALSSETIAKCETEGSIKKAEYNKMLQLDSLIDTIQNKSLPVTTYRHPWVIYTQFITNPNFGFADYKDQNFDDSSYIFDGAHIFWLLRFFIYGSVDSNSLIQLNTFIRKVLETGNEAGMRNTIDNKQFQNFLYDTTFRELCNNPHFINQFDFQKPKLDNQESVNITETINKSRIDRADFASLDDTFDIFAKYSEANVQFSPITIDGNEDWSEKYSSKSFMETIDQNDVDILSAISERILHFNPRLNDEFPKWLLNDKYSLLSRQVYVTLKRIHESLTDETKKEEAKREFIVFRKIANPWNNQPNQVISLWLQILDRITEKSFTNYTEFCKIFNGLNINQIPYFFALNPDDNEYYLIQEKNLNTVSIPKMLFEYAMKPESITDTNKLSKVINFFHYFPFVQHTKYLPILSSFVHKLVGYDLFCNQLNLLYLVFVSQQNCVDLLSIPNVNFSIIPNINNEFNGLLKEAFDEADQFGEGSNALDKLTSYVNHLIRINNETILCEVGNDPKPFRFIFNNNLHSNLCLRNTFIPAFAHLKDEASLTNAFDLLKGSTASSIKDLFSPDCGDFSKPFYNKNSQIQFLQIEGGSNLLGFPANSIYLSLATTFAEYIFIHQDSTVSKIWKHIIENPVSYNSDESDKSRILETLIPLFMEYSDESKYNSKLEKYIATKPSNSFRTPGLQYAIVFLKENSPLFDLINRLYQELDQKTKANESE